jgi:hypothetical protein
MKTYVLLLKTKFGKKEFFIYTCEANKGIEIKFPTVMSSEQESLETTVLEK